MRGSELVIRRQDGLTPQERIDAYARAFPKFPPSMWVGNGGRIEGLWIMGQNYTTQSLLYGAYPHGYVARVTSMFPDCVRTLQLFSGSLKRNDMHIRVDSKMMRRPDVLGDAHHLRALFPPCSFDIIYADPPYSNEDALRYGTVMISRKKVLEECRFVVKVGGWVIWLDQVQPQYSKEYWRQGLVLGMIKSTNHRVRAVFGFQRIK